MKFIFLFLLLSSLQVQAGVVLPINLSSEDRIKILKILGLGTSSKILSDPYPLGGYSGVEIGMNVESVPTYDLSRLGAQTPPERSVVYPKLSLGKGFYNNIDVFLQFLPYNKGTNMGSFGGIFRWAIYQAAFFPATFSILVHGSSVNVGNLFFSETYGADLVTGINVTNFSLYLGGGKLISKGIFQRELNQGQSQDLSESVEAIHGFFGITFNVDSLFLAAQVDQYIDQYSQATSSLKMGLRF